MLGAAAYDLICVCVGNNRSFIVLVFPQVGIANTKTLRPPSPQQSAFMALVDQATRQAKQAAAAKPGEVTDQQAVHAQAAAIAVLANLPPSTPTAHLHVASPAAPAPVVPSAVHTRGRRALHFEEGGREGEGAEEAHPGTAEQPPLAGGLLEIQVHEDDEPHPAGSKAARPRGALGPLAHASPESPSVPAQPQTRRSNDGHGVISPAPPSTATGASKGTPGPRQVPAQGGSSGTDSTAATLQAAQSKAAAAGQVFVKRQYCFAVEIWAGPADTVFRHTKVGEPGAWVVGWLTRVRVPGSGFNHPDPLPCQLISPRTTEKCSHTKTSAPPLLPQLVTVKNKYIILNDTGLTIEYKQKGTPDPVHGLGSSFSYGPGRRFAGRLHHNAKTALHWDNKYLAKELVIRPVGKGWWVAHVLHDRPGGWGEGLPWLGCVGLECGGPWHDQGLSQCDLLTSFISPTGTGPVA